MDTSDYLTRRQERKMASRPTMVVEFARYVEDRMRKGGISNVEIRAYVSSSLNGREPQLLIDPEDDLTKVPFPWIGHADWISPLQRPLRSGTAGLAD